MVPGGTTTEANGFGLCVCEGIILIEAEEKENPGMTIAVVLRNEEVFFS